MIPISYNLRSLLVRPRTTLTTAFGIAMVVFVLASTQMLARGVANTFARSGAADRAVVLSKGAESELTSGFDLSLHNRIAASDGVRRDAAGRPQHVAEVMVMIGFDKIGGDGEAANVQVRGVPPDALEFRDTVRVIAGRPMRPGVDEVMIGSQLRGQFRGLSLGESFEIRKNRSVKVVGVFEAAGSSHESEIWGDIEVIKSSFAREQTLSSMTVALESEQAFERFRAAVEQDRQLEVQAVRESTYYERLSEGTVDLIGFLGGAIVSFFALGAMLGAMITMQASVAQRRREIGVMRAIGFSPLTVLACFLFEAFLLASAGGAFGALASMGMGFLRFSIRNQATWSTINFAFEAAPDIVVRSLLVGGLMGIAGGLMPALRAARMPPVAAMRRR